MTRKNILPPITSDKGRVWPLRLLENPVFPRRSSLIVLEALECVFYLVVSVYASSTETPLKKLELGKVLGHL